MPKTADITAYDVCRFLCVNDRILPPIIKLIFNIMCLSQSHEGPYFLL